MLSLSGIAGSAFVGPHTVSPQPSRVSPFQPSMSASFEPEPRAVGDYQFDPLGLGTSETITPFREAEARGAAGQSHATLTRSHITHTRYTLPPAEHLPPPLADQARPPRDAGRHRVAAARDPPPDPGGCGAGGRPRRSGRPGWLAATPRSANLEQSRKSSEQEGKLDELRAAR